MTSHEKTSQGCGPLAIALLGTPYLVIISWLDAALFFEAFPIRLLLGFLWVLLGVTWARKTPASLLMIGVIALWTAAILPGVRWNHGKAFYIDAHRIKRGMNVEEVRHLMAPYIDVDRDLTPKEQEMMLWPKARSNRMMFLHTTMFADTCAVHFRDGLVVDVDIQKD